MCSICISVPHWQKLNFKFAKPNIFERNTTLGLVTMTVLHEIRAKNFVVWQTKKIYMQMTVVLCVVVNTDKRFIFSTIFWLKCSLVVGLMCLCICVCIKTSGNPY